MQNDVKEGNDEEEERKGVIMKEAGGRETVIVCVEEKGGVTPLSLRWLQVERTLWSCAASSCCLSVECA